MIEEKLCNVTISTFLSSVSHVTAIIVFVFVITNQRRVKIKSGATAEPINHVGDRRHVPFNLFTMSLNKFVSLLCVCKTPFTLYGAGKRLDRPDLLKPVCTNFSVLSCGGS